MIKLARRVCEDVEPERSDVEKHRLVINKQLAKQTHVLHEQLRLRTIDLPEDVRPSLIYLAAWGMGICTCSAVRMKRRCSAHVLEAALAYPQRWRLPWVRTGVPGADHVLIKHHTVSARFRTATYRSMTRSCSCSVGAVASASDMPRVEAQANLRTATTYRHVGGGGPVPESLRQAGCFGSIGRADKYHRYECCDRFD